MAGGVSKITVEIGGKLAASLTSSLRQAQAQVSSFSRNVNRTFNDAATAGARGFKGLLRNDAFQAAAASAASVGIALGGSIRAASNFENVLTDIGKTSGASNTELKALSQQLLGLSVRNKTNLAPTVLAQGVQDLVAQGLDLKDAVASMEALGRVATATGSDLLDVTKTGFQLQNALKIRPTELKATFDALAYAGKQGAFELKDMAQFMPTIAAAAGTLGIQGKQGAISLAAMMQMVRKDAPDAGQAATRLTDAMLKMTAPDAVKRFKKFGVNIEQVLANAKKKGINPMEAALDELQRVTGGDVFKLSQIFGDKEAKLGLMSLMKYRQEYERLKKEAGGDVAAGTVDQDFTKSIETFSGNLATFQNTAQKLGIVIGNALLPALTGIATTIMPVVDAIANAAQQFPQLTSVVVALGTAFVGLVAVSPFIASFISVLGALKLAIATTSIGATIAGWAGAIGPAFAGIAAIITGPVGLAIAAIVGIGVAVAIAYNKVGWFRDGVNSAMARVREIFAGSLKAITGAFKGWLKYLGGLGKIVQGIFTLDGKRIQQGFSQALGGAKQVGSSWLGWMNTLWPGVKDGAARAWSGLSGVASRALDGVKGAFSGAVSSIKGAFAGLRSWFQQLWSQIMSAGLGQVISGVQQIFNGLTSVVKGVWNVIVGIITGDSQRAVAGVRQAFSGVGAIFQGIGNVARGALGLLTAYVQTVFNGVRTAGAMAWSGIQAAASAAWSGITSAAQAALSMIRSAATSAWSGVVAAATGAWSSIVAAAMSLPGRLAAAWAAIRAGAVSAFMGIVSFIRSVPGMVVGVGEAIINTIINGIKSRASAMVATVRETFAEVRKLMPFSDAKDGPFRHLTASGKAIISTMADGVREASPLLGNRMHDAAGDAMRSVGRAQEKAAEAMRLPEPQAPALAAPEPLHSPQLTAAGVAMRSTPFVPQYAPPPQRERGGFLQGLMPMLSRVLDRFAPQAKGYLTMGQTLMGSLREGNILPSLEAGLGAVARQFMPQASEFIAPLMRGLGEVRNQVVQAPAPKVIAPAAVQAPAAQVLPTAPVVTPAPKVIAPAAVQAPAAQVLPTAPVVTPAPKVIASSAPAQRQAAPFDQGLLAQLSAIATNFARLVVPAPEPSPALAGIPAPARSSSAAGLGGMTMNPTININVAGTNASAEEIADQVRYAFQSILGDAEAGVRAFLND
jgi:TP901 family phage tail tape measure protein